MKEHFPCGNVPISKSMTTAVYPGTFDPFTLGHLDVLKRAARLFDCVILAVARSEKKRTLFSLQERVALAKASCEGVQGLENVRVEGFDGLLCDFARAHGVTVSIRGARAVSDFEYEFQMAGMNRTLMPEVETIFLMPALNCQFVSGSVVREIASLGGDVSDFVPEPVRCALLQRFTMKKAQP